MYRSTTPARTRPQAGGQQCRRHPRHPELLERGRVRAAAERLPVEFLEGDAENLR